MERERKQEKGPAVLLSIIPFVVLVGLIVCAATFGGCLFLNKVDSGLT